MPLFHISNNALTIIEQTNFASEMALQTLMEQNLKTVFNCRFVATEFPTGAQHAGRIDTLALSEDDNPVIIEYKKIQSSELINQSLYYLHWIDDHRGDFEVAARKALGNKVTIDWSAVRVICIAPNFTKYDVHAVQVMGAAIELWQYRLHANSTLLLEEIFGKSLLTAPEGNAKGKNPVMVAAGKKAALTKATGVYTYEQHVADKPKAMVEIATAIQEFTLALDPGIQEVPKKLYVAYKVSKNIHTMTILKQSVVLYVALDPTALMPLPEICRDVRKIGHWGTGDLEIELKTIDDVDVAKKFIALAYQKTGGA